MRKIVLWMALFVMCGALVGCSSWITAMDAKTSDLQEINDSYPLLEPETEGASEQQPNSLGLFVFSGQGTAGSEPVSLDFFGNITVKMLEGGKIGLGTKPGGKFIEGDEVYTILGGGGGINITERTINYSVNAQDPHGKPGIARFRGIITDLNVGADGWVDGTFNAVITGEYVEGEEKTVVTYTTATIQLKSTARTGTMTISGTGTAFEPDHGFENVSVTLTGNVRAFPATSTDTENENKIVFQATGGTVTIGDEIYYLDNGNANIDLLRDGQFHYVCNFHEADGTKGIYVLNGTIPALVLDPTGKVSGAFPVTFSIHDANYYQENKPASPEPKKKNKNKKQDEPDMKKEKTKKEDKNTKNQPKTVTVRIPFYISNMTVTLNVP
jgi:hypothetical protein